MGKILIRGCAILPMTGEKDFIPAGEVAVNGDRILSVGLPGSSPPDWKPDRIIEGRGTVAMPGLINCHTHAAMTLMRGYADDLPLMEWLNDKVWPLEAKLTGEDIYRGTKLAALEMIKGGVTTFADMYFFMDQAARAVDESGMRACLSRGLIGVGDNAELALEESRALYQDWHGQAGDRIRVWLGPHAPYTCPPDYLKRVLELAAELNAPIHIHVAETRDECQQVQAAYGKSPVKHLEAIGLFERQVLAAHCVHVDAEDISILKACGVGVAHNPESNMKLASGIAPVIQMLEAGIPVALGTDGACSNNNLDMIQEMRSASFLQKVTSGDPTVLPAYQALQMGTVNGAAALGMEQEIGKLVPGFKADLITIDLEKPHLCPKHGLAANLAYAAQAADVRSVIINGELVMHDRKVLTMNEEDVLRETERASESLLRRL